VEKPKKGFGKGAFVVISGEKRWRYLPRPCAQGRGLSNYSHFYVMYVRFV